MNLNNYEKLRKRTLWVDILLIISLTINVSTAHYALASIGEERKEIVINESDIMPEVIELVEPAKIVEPVEPEKPTVNQRDLELLAMVIYQEAGGDNACDDCRRMVADVVLNRVEDSRFPNDIHGVLTAPRQYGRYHWTGVVWPERANNPGEKAAVDRAYRIAEEVLLGKHSNLYGNGYIWQAEFKQGTDIVFCDGIYFGRG